jgi:hypothetical protein
MNSWHRATVAGLAALALGGCKDMGLNELQEFDVASRAGVTPLVQQTMRIQSPSPNQVVHLGGQYWIATSNRYTLGASDVATLGQAGGTSFYRLAWDDEPYDRVLGQGPAGLVEYRLL